MEKSDAMSKVSAKLNIVFSYVLLFRAREAWANLQPCFTKDLLR